MLSPRSSFIIVLLIQIAFPSFSQVRRDKTPLPVAIATGQVRVSIRGTGGSSGDSIKLHIARGPAAADALEISVPPGTILRNGNSAGQNMVVGEVLGRMVGESSYAPASHIELSGTSDVTYVLTAFCLNFEKDNPSEADSFSAEAPDATLACIMKNSSQLSVPTRQAAVWIYSDNINYAHMNQKFSVTEEEFSQGRDVVNACR
jgi:hypothetical protein